MIIAVLRPVEYASFLTDVVSEAERFACQFDISFYLSSLARHLYCAKHFYFVQVARLDLARHLYCAKLTAIKDYQTPLFLLPCGLFFYT